MPSGYVKYPRFVSQCGNHHLQVFVPFQSEMYASTRDPPEHREIPICTLKNFPYATEHTLRWAVETFEALFKQRPVDVNHYLSNKEYQASVHKSPPNTRLPVLETLRDALVRHRPLRFALVGSVTLLLLPIQHDEVCMTILLCWFAVLSRASNGHGCSLKSCSLIV